MVTRTEWTGEEWEVEADGMTERADFVVMATGVLHHPNVPDIPGLGDFAGTTLHSARWDDTVDYAGKRVAVIGTGSTGVQLVSEMRRSAEQVTLFSRSPQWVLWGPTEMRQPALVSELMRRVPFVNRLGLRGPPPGHVAVHGRGHPPVVAQAAPPGVGQAPAGRGER